MAAAKAGQQEAAAELERHKERSTDIQRKAAASGSIVQQVTPPELEGSCAPEPWSLCNEKCRFTGIFDRLPDQFYRLLDRFSNKLASHCLEPAPET